MSPYIRNSGIHKMNHLNNKKLRVPFNKTSSGLNLGNIAK